MNPQTREEAAIRIKMNKLVESKFDTDSITEMYHKLFVDMAVYGYLAGAEWQNKQLLAVVKELKEVLTEASRRFSHIENWHRDYVTPDNFKDCQDVGQTPESYLRSGKIKCRETLAKVDAMMKDMNRK